MLSVPRGPVLLSFITPTLNEERMLGRNLKQYEVLDFPHEVIVADGGSTDLTRSIARQNGARVVVTQGAQTIAANRNTGAAEARAGIFVFCDADTLFDDLPYFCQRVLQVFEDPEVVAAMPRIRVFPGQEIIQDKAFHYVYNNSIRLSFKTLLPFGTGQCQVIRASAFRAIGGYRAEQVHGEDASIFRYLRKQGRLVYLPDCTILESPRRYRHYGYFRYLTLAGASIVGQKITGRNMLSEWKRVG